MHVLTFRHKCAIIVVEITGKVVLFMFCKNCGAEISDGAEYCPECRSRVGGSEPEAVSAPIPPAPEMPAAGAVPPQQEDYGAGAAKVVAPLEAPVKRKKKPNLAVCVVFAVIFGIFSMWFLQAGAFVFALHNGITEHAVSEAVSKIDFSDIKLDGVIPDDLLRNIGEARDETESDIAGIVSRLSGGNLTREQAEEIVSRLDLGKDIAKLVKGYEDYILNGSSDIDIAGELERIILGAKQVYTDVTGKEPATSFDEDVISAIQDNAAELQKAAPQAVLNGMDGAIRAMVSPVVWIVLLVLAVFFPVLSGLISRRVSVGLMCGGAAFTLSGAGLMLSSALTNSMAKMAVQYEALSDIVSRVISEAFDSRLMNCGIAYTAVGVVLIVVFIVVRIRAAKSRA